MCGWDELGLAPPISGTPLGPISLTQFSDSKLAPGWVHLWHLTGV